MASSSSYMLLVWTVRSSGVSLVVAARRPNCAEVRSKPEDRFAHRVPMAHGAANAMARTRSAHSPEDGRRNQGLRSNRNALNPCVRRLGLVTPPYWKGATATTCGQARATVWPEHGPHASLIRTKSGAMNQVLWPGRTGPGRLCTTNSGSAAENGADGAFVHAVPSFVGPFQATFWATPPSRSNYLRSISVRSWGAPVEVGPLQK